MRGETGPNTGNKRAQLLTSILHIHILTFQAREAGFVGSCSKLAIKMGNRILQVLDLCCGILRYFACEFYVTLRVVG